jgi:hypothetical protein
VEQLKKTTEDIRIIRVLTEIPVSSIILVRAMKCEYMKLHSECNSPVMGIIHEWKLKRMIFGAVTPCSSKKSRRFGGTHCLYLQCLRVSRLFFLLSCFAYSSTLKVDVIFSSETSGCLQTKPNSVLFVITLVGTQGTAMNINYFMSLSELKIMRSWACLMIIGWN